jgi:hypothetical protein
VFAVAVVGGVGDVGGGAEADVAGGVFAGAPGGFATEFFARDGFDGASPVVGEIGRFDAGNVGGSDLAVIAEALASLLRWRRVLLGLLGLRVGLAGFAAVGHGKIL